MPFGHIIMRALPATEIILYSLLFILYLYSFPRRGTISLSVTFGATSPRGARLFYHKLYNLSIPLHKAKRKGWKMEQPNRRVIRRRTFCTPSDEVDSFCAFYQAIYSLTGNTIYKNSSVSPRKIQGLKLLLKSKKISSVSDAFRASNKNLWLKPISKSSPVFSMGIISWA